MSFNPMPVLGSQKTWQSQPDDYVVVWNAGAITLPDVGYRLVRVLVETGATPGAFHIVPDGITHCYFPSGSNATNGAQAYAVLWSVKGTNLPAALFGLDGGASSAILTFSKGKSMGPDLMAYRAIRFTVTTSGAHAAPTALTKTTYDIAPAIPSGAIAVSTVVGSAFYWPQMGTAQSGGPADSQPSQVSVHTAPTGIPKATSLTPLYTNSTAAGTMDLYVGYEPAA